MTWDHLYAPDEEYLQIAVTHLLPRYYATPADQTAGAILRRLAARQLTRHGDAWLADVLRTPHSQNSGVAFRALSRAYRAALDWNYVAGGQEARAALTGFESVRSKAGVLYTKLTQIYALDRGRECADLAVTIQPSLAAHHYSWLGAQTLLEEVACSILTNDLARTDATEREASERVNGDSGYPVLALRLAGLTAGRYPLIGNMAAAWRENSNGLRTYWEGSYPLVRAQQFYSSLSLLSADNHAADSDIAWAKELVSIAASLQRQNVYGAALWQLGMAELEAGQTDAGRRDIDHAMQIVPLFRSDPTIAIMMAEAETSHAQTDSALKRLHAIRGTIEGSNQLTRLRFETILGRTHVVRGEYSQAMKQFDTAREMGESAWSHAPAHDRLLWMRTMESIYRGLLECRIRTGDDPRTSRAVWAQYRAHLFERGTVDATSGSTVASGEARLSFAALSTHVAVWLETSRGIWFREIESGDRLRQAAERLARECASEHTTEAVLRADSKELTQRLVGSWDVQLSGIRTIVLEIDAPVASVPWSVLVRPNGHYWAQDFGQRIRVAAGTGTPSQPPLASVERVLAVGAPAISGEEGLVALPHALEEAANVCARFPHSICLTGQSATWNTIRQQLAGIQLFHFAGHGYGGEGGGLLLRGPEGRLALLRGADIRGVDLSRCRLAVLSGCSTAAGESAGPGHPESLVRAFLLAGARNVVAGLWNLDSAGTQLFMRKFYDAIVSGKPVDASLRRATETVRQDVRFSHPYYWAGLEVFSEN